MNKGFLQGYINTRINKYNIRFKKRLKSFIAFKTEDLAITLSQSTFTNRFEKLISRLYPKYLIFRIKNIQAFLNDGSTTFFDFY